MVNSQHQAPRKESVDGFQKETDASFYSSAPSTTVNPALLYLYLSSLSSSECRIYSSSMCGRPIGIWYNSALLSIASEDRVLVVLSSNRGGGMGGFFFVDDVGSYVIPF